MQLVKSGIFLLSSCFLCYKLNAQPKFVKQVLDSAISIGYGLAIGDVDGDKKPDILLADKKQFVWYRNGDWKKFIMIENLTESDNVCITARDLDGDGKVEVAVGAQWSPGETKDSLKSGSVHYLVRPEDPTQKWRAIRLPHEPTIHRMRWIRSAEGTFFLLVLPLHGKGNVDGAGVGVNLLVYEFPPHIDSAWKTSRINTGMHLTHNLDILPGNTEADGSVLIAGREGIKIMNNRFDKINAKELDTLASVFRAAGEVRSGKITSARNFIATIEPMHGTEVVAYVSSTGYTRIVLDNNIKEGHALGVADFLGVGTDQLVAGWRNANADGKTGIRMYSPTDLSGSSWKTFTIDDNTIACEDLQVADLDGDGKPDIIASGRASKNVIIYWNRRS